ncbi:hypothetical protein DNHGIG_11770 [Collibacillus ludicampi]|uniref:HTH merR-type domain-containing protein n=1 Tax=Collibacillus ludicampi TaxID=2771369 RepID=A0AAV4LD82_9BACL|nr:hypothetical protein [Collibacillus ludicampi]GIM45628.1 hypothetical protein DNHGIG_11770 [Collibacillus ludicampi]
MGNVEFERFWTSKEVCNTFRITGSTLRKWCLQLEALGYAFSRNDNNQRLFKAADREVLQQLKWDLDAGFPLENAAKSVLARLGRVPRTDAVPSETSIVSSETHTMALAEDVKQQLFDEFRKIVREEVREEHKRFSQDFAPIQAHMTKLNELLQTMQEEIAATHDLLAAWEEADSKKNQSWWKRWFGNKS